ncbi:MAG: glycosyltransferase [Syntrophomonas sp.]
MKFVFVSFLNPYNKYVTGGSEDIRRRIEVLAGEHNIVHVFALDKKKYLDSSNVPSSIDIKTYGRHLKIGRSIFKLPFPIISRYNRNMIKDLTDFVEPDSIIIVEGLQGALIWNCLPSNIRNNNYSIMRLHNIESNYYNAMSKSSSSFLRSLVYRITSFQYECLESSCFDEFDEIHAISCDEVDELIAFYPRLAPKIKWAPPIALPQRKVKAKNESSKMIIGYFGDLRLPINSEGVSWFIEEVLPLISDRYNVEFHIAGHDSAKYADIPGVITLGFVKNLEDFINTLDVVVVPIRQGAGVKIKMIDSIAFGIPLITTSVGIEGTDSTIRDGVWLAENSTEFLAAIDYIFNNKALSFAKASKTRDWLLSQYGSLAYLKLFSPQQSQACF